MKGTHEQPNGPPSALSATGTPRLSTIFNELKNACATLTEAWLTPKETPSDRYTDPKRTAGPSHSSR